MTRFVLLPLMTAIALAGSPGVASAQETCRDRFYAAMNQGLLSIRTDGALLVAVVAPTFWPAADRAAQERLVNDLDCAMNNPGATGQFAVMDETSGELIAIKSAGVVTFPD